MINKHINQILVSTKENTSDVIESDWDAVKVTLTRKLSFK